MTVKITIRNVPDEVRDKLAARAEIRHQSMQSYLLSELELIAAKPRNELVYERVTESRLSRSNHASILTRSLARSKTDANGDCGRFVRPSFLFG